MIEIFTTVAGQENSTSRVFSNDTRLTRPTDIYFGSGTPGIAFYEKSGADLRVTLLNGQEVMLRDFFVIGANGEYSRLREGGPSGSIEVTGLIAPEPYVPTGVTQTAPTDSPLPQTQSASTGALSTPGETSENAAPEPTPAARSFSQPVEESGATMPAGAAGSAPETLGGFAFDRLAFGTAMLPAAALMFRGSKDEASAPPSALRSAAAPAGAEEGAGDEEGAAGEGGMDPDLAALLRGIADGLGQEGAGHDTPVRLMGSPAGEDYDPGPGGPDALLQMFDPLWLPMAEG